MYKMYPLGAHKLSNMYIYICIVQGVHLSSTCGSDMNWSV